jgi:hypothetical protein
VSAWRDTGTRNTASASSDRSCPLQETTSLPHGTLAPVGTHLQRPECVVFTLLSRQFPLSQPARAHPAALTTRTWTAVAPYTSIESNLRASWEEERQRERKRNNAICVAEKALASVDGQGWPNRAPGHVSPTHPHHSSICSTHCNQNTTNSDCPLFLLRQQFPPKDGSPLKHVSTSSHHFSLVPSIYDSDCHVEVRPLFELPLQR